MGAMSLKAFAIVAVATSFAFPPIEAGAAQDNNTGILQGLENSLPSVKELDSMQFMRDNNQRILDLGARLRELEAQWPVLDKFLEGHALLASEFSSFETRLKNVAVVCHEQDARVERLKDNPFYSDKIEEQARECWNDVRWGRDVFMRYNEYLLSLEYYVNGARELRKEILERIPSIETQLGLREERDILVELQKAVQRGLEDAWEIR